MDDQLIRTIQRAGADALLDTGVSLPLYDFRIPLRKAPLHLRLTMKRPTLSKQIKIARTYLNMGITSEELQQLDHNGQMRFIAEHGSKLSDLIALTVDSRWLPLWLISWIVRRFVKWEYQKAAFDKFVSLIGTDPFMNIIRSAEMMNPMKLRLSHGKKGS